MASQVWLGQSLWRLPRMFTASTGAAECIRRMQILVRCEPLAMGNQVYLGQVPWLWCMHEPASAVPTLVRCEPLAMGNQVCLGQLRWLR